MAMQIKATAVGDIVSLEQGFRELGYVADRDLLTPLFLTANLGRPLLLEGNAGVGKTETAKVLAQLLDTELIRLQCYEGLDAAQTLYEWNYQKQLLAIRVHESRSEGRPQAADPAEQPMERNIFSREYLLERPLLKAISAKDASPVLLIDEVDRADEEFEAFLLELLGDFQVTIPEIGTIRAVHRPLVILTSNRMRELSDALKRRCLYHWIGYPDLEREVEIVTLKVPGIAESLAHQIVRVVQALRELDLEKPPGVAETLDWAIALLALGRSALNAESIAETKGCFLKTTADFDVLQAQLSHLVDSANPS